MFQGANMRSNYVSSKQNLASIYFIIQKIRLYYFLLYQNLTRISFNIQNATPLCFSISKPDQNIFPGVKMRADYV